MDKKEDCGMLCHIFGCNIAGRHHTIALMHPVVWLGTESPSLNCGQAVRSSGEEYFL